MRITQYIRENRWFDAAFLFVFIAAFAGATYNHVYDLVRGGLFPYADWYGAPEFLNVFWTSLTLLDPLAIAALMINVRVGYGIAIGIMLLDVPINVYANLNYWSLPIYQNYALMMQAGFLIFLLVTWPRVRCLSRSSRRTAI